MRGIPILAVMKWRTSRGKFATKQCPTAIQFLHRCAYFWKQPVIHVWDRGFANEAWLAQAFRFEVQGNRLKMK